MMNDTMTSRAKNRELVRLRSDRMVAGVASGLGRRFDVGTGWVRLGFIVATFFGGLGILLYVIGWLVIRDETEAASLAERWIGDLEGAGAWVGVALIVLAAMVVLGATNVVRGELIFAAGLFIAGVLLYRGRLPTSSRRTQGPVTEPPSRSDGGDEAHEGAPGQRTETVALGTTGDAETARVEMPTGEMPPGWAPPAPPVVPSPPPPPSPRQVRAPRPRSYLGRFTVAASLILVGVVALLDNLGVIDPALRHYAAGVLLVIGGGLLVGSLFGRARGLIALGLLSIPFVLVVSAVRTPFAGDWGDRSFVPIAATELQTEYELSGGSLRIDLRNLDEIGGGAGFTADVGFGELVVYVPSDAAYAIDVTAEVGIGELNIAGDQRGGFGLDDATSIGDADGPTLGLDLEVGIGSLRVIATP